MGETVTRRQYLAVAGVTIALAGCSVFQENPDRPPQTPGPATSTDTLVVPSDTPTSVSHTSTQTTVSGTTKAPRTSAGESQQPVRNGGGGDGLPPTPTIAVTPTPSPTRWLIIPAGETHRETSVDFYKGIEWHDTGRLVIENGAGLGLEDTNP